MVKKILMLTTLMLVGFLIFIFLQPADFNISRELLVQAAPSKIFPHINNAKMADAWMPWKDSDPTVKINYSGPEEGVGSISSWDSTGKMGTGKAEIVESQSDQFVKTQLTYTRPMTMSQLAEISLTSQEKGTLVKWSVTGQNSFMGRLFCFFMNMDKSVSGEFEKGLAKLKSTVEKD